MSIKKKDWPYWRLINEFMGTGFCIWSLTAIQLHMYL